MAALRCADVTLQHGYRYFVGIRMADLSSNSSFTTPGYANTYGSDPFSLQGNRFMILLVLTG